MTQAPQPRFAGGSSGFISNDDAMPPANVPLKNGIRRRVQPVCELRIDGWLLTPETLYRIATDLRAKARAAGQARHFGRPDQQLVDAADALADFMNARRLYGEKPGRPWS